MRHTANRRHCKRAGGGIRASMLDAECTTPSACTTDLDANRFVRGRSGMLCDHRCGLYRRCHHPVPSYTATHGVNLKLVPPIDFCVGFVQHTRPRCIHNTTPTVWAYMTLYKLILCGTSETEPHLPTPRSARGLGSVNDPPPQLPPRSTVSGASLPAPF